MFLFAVLWGSSVEDCSTAAVAAVAAETGTILSVQCCGSHTADVHVCSAGSLDGLCLVLHRSEGAGESWLLGYR